MGLTQVPCDPLRCSHLIALISECTLETGFFCITTLTNRFSGNSIRA